jgi:hypothetical protein
MSGKPTVPTKTLTSKSGSKAGIDTQPVQAGAREEEMARSGLEPPEHDCWESAVPYVSDGILSHGWECGICGAFIQAG